MSTVAFAPATTVAATEMCPILPRHIDLDRVIGGFGSPEANVVARAIVRLAQQQGHWGRMAEAELALILGEACDGLAGLERIGQIRRFDHGSVIYVTHSFVTFCYHMAPATSGVLINRA